MYGAADFYRISEMPDSGNFERIGVLPHGGKSYDEDHHIIPASSSSYRDKRADINICDMGHAGKRLPCKKPPQCATGGVTAISSETSVLRKAPREN